MSDYSAFDIIGPRMTGPSSSHTAGAARIGRMAYKLAKPPITAAEITMYGSFAETGPGHGTDKALVAGLLGMEPDDRRLRYSLLLAEEAGIEVKIRLSGDDMPHPNTARIVAHSAAGDTLDMTGVSVGGGNILITSINGLEVEFSGQLPTVIFKQNDVPGVINHVTSILAEEQINIAFMRVFRDVKRGMAYMVIETDSPIDPAVTERIFASSYDIREVRQI